MAPFLPRTLYLRVKLNIEMNIMFKTGISQLFCGVLLVVLVSCNTYKSAQKTLLDGNYDKVITMMTYKYKKGVKEKNKRKLVTLLHEAYLKANTRDLEMIERYKQSLDVNKDRDIYFAYRNIQNRQDNIKPYLPITLNGKVIHFPIHNYVPQVEKYKESYANILYNEASILLINPSKPDAQRAFGLLKDLEGLYPKYKNTRNLKNRAYKLGTTFVYVDVRNSSEYLMPKAIDEHLRILDTKYLNKNWKEFHTILERGIEYDYDVLYDIQDLIVSPEVISRKQFVSEKEVIDGWEYEKNAEGNFVLDSLNNKIKVDIINVLRAEVNELHYDKNALMNVKVAIINNRTNRIEYTRTFESNRFFSDFSCNISGNEEALEEDYRKTIKDKIAPFPSDIDIVLDCVDDIKEQTKSYFNSKL